MLNEKPGALRRSQSEAPYTAQYLTPVDDEEEDTQAKNRRAAVQQGRMQRTVALFSAVLVICLLTAWAAVAGKPAPISPVSHAPLIFAKDTPFSHLLNIAKNNGEKKEATDEQEEDVLHMQEDASQKQPCVECSSNGICSGGKCQCLQSWSGPTCSVLNTVEQSTQIALKSSHELSVVFPFQDRHTGSYHLFFHQRSNVFDEKLGEGNGNIFNAISSLPASGYQMTKPLTLVTAKKVQDPSLVWLPMTELYLMFFSEVDCKPGSKACAQSPASIRVAFTSNLSGGWTVAAAPVLTGSDVQWEGHRLTSPAAVVQQDESVILFYHGHAGIGMAKANKWNAAYERFAGNPLFPSAELSNFFAWMTRGHFHLLACVNNNGPAVHGYSRDAVKWQLDTSKIALSSLNVTHDIAPFPSNTHVRVRGRRTAVKRQGVPTILFQGGVPAYLFTVAQHAGTPGSFIVSTPLTQPT